MLTVIYGHLKAILAACWPHLKSVLSAGAVGIEIALVGAWIAWLQLRYAKRRDNSLDKRNAWTEVHKAMLEFRFRREMLNQGTGSKQVESAPDAMGALHQLRGQLNRVESPLAIEIENYLQENWEAEQWRAAVFTEKFDEYAQEAARKSRRAIQD